MKTIKQSYDTIKMNNHRKQVILDNILTQSSVSKEYFRYKKFIFSVVLICIIAFIGIQYIPINPLNTPLENHKNASNTKTTLDTVPYNITLQELQDLDFYIFANGIIYNPQIIHSFIDDIDNTKPSHVRIAIVTDEGDPILNEIYYHPQNGVTLYNDTTRDQFGPKNLTKEFYQKIGVYDDAIYAYNTELTKETIDQNKACFITYTHQKKL